MLKRVCIRTSFAIVKRKFFESLWSGGEYRLPLKIKVICYVIVSPTPPRLVRKKNNSFQSITFFIVHNALAL